MLPVGNISSLMYPMNADIYYASYEQNNMGEMVSTWLFDRTIKCSAIKERPTSAIANVVQSNKFIEYETQLDFRTEENILIDSGGVSHQISDTLIQKITDPAGTLVWFEDNISDPTKFEINNIEPMFDPFHKLFGYRVLLKRAEDQDV